MKKMDEEILKIYDEAIEKSYYLKSIECYWTGYFLGKVTMNVSHPNLDRFYKKVMIASHLLYNNKLHEQKCGIKSL